MKIIPAAPSEELTQTEHKVFDLVRRVDWGSGAIGISSLNLAEHEYKRWGEIDFVLLGVEGLLAIEVKGGNVSCADGIWRYSNFKGTQTVVRSESPYAQVKSAFFSLERHFRGSNLGLGRHVPGGFCVIFASMRREDMRGIVGGPETPSVITGTSEDIETPQSFRRFLDRVIRHWREHEPGMSGRLWTPAQIKQIAQFLRPDFDRAVPLSLRMRSIRDERVRFTEEQYQLLDFLEENPRLFVTGGAGCGKTFLAVELARRERSGGSKVAFVTGSEYLATYLRAEAQLPSGVSVLTVSELAKYSADGGPLFDVAIVDEGQQATTAAVWSLLDRVVKDGVERGRWRWFGDYARQVALDSYVEDETFELLKMVSTHQHLIQNCRNTPQTVQAAEMISGVRIGRAMVRGAGPNLIWKTQKKREDVPQSAADQLIAWLTADVSVDDVVLLYASDAGMRDALDAAQRAGIRLRALRDLYRNQVRQPTATIASIREFRGLESEHILVFGLDDITDDQELRALSYIAITRASFAAAIAGLVQTRDRLLEMSLATVEGFRGITERIPPSQPMRH